MEHISLQFAKKPTGASLSVLQALNEQNTQHLHRDVLKFYSPEQITSGSNKALKLTHGQQIKYRGNKPPPPEAEFIST